MFVTRKTYDAVVRERDEALALVAKLRRGCETRAAIDAAIISGRDSTIKELEEELSHTYVHDARGRIMRHPLNTGGKVKA